MSDIQPAVNPMDRPVSGWNVLGWFRPKKPACELIWHYDQQVIAARALVATLQNERLKHRDLEYGLQKLVDRWLEWLPPDSHRLLVNKLVPVAAQAEDFHHWAELTAMEVYGEHPEPETVGRFDAVLSEAMDIVDEHVIPVDEGATLESSPLRDRWRRDAREYLDALIELTDEHIVPERAFIYLIPTLTGEVAKTYPLEDIIEVEAEQSTALTELPYVIRLGWLVAQLNMNELSPELELPEEKLDLLKRLALVPVTLSASEAVGWCVCHENTIEQAAQTWLGKRKELTKPTIEALDAWWEVYRERRPPWKSALTALHRMLKW